MSLLQIVSKSARDAYLWSDDGLPVYDLAGKSQRRKTACDIHEIAGTRESAAGDRYTFTVSRNGDLFGECFLHLTSKDLGGNVFMSGRSDILPDLIERVEFEIGGQTIESFTGRTMAAIATFDFRAEPSALGRVCVVPLRLCTSASNDTFLPLVCLRFHEVNVRVTLVEKAAAEIEKVALHIEYVALDSFERQQTCQANHRLRIHPKSSAEALLTRPPPPPRTGNDEDSVAVELFPWLEEELVRDLIVDVDAARSPSALSIELEMSPGKYTELTRLDSIMASHVIPKHRYGIRGDSYSAKRFYIPFDSDPTAPLCASAMMFGKNRARMRIWFEDRACHVDDACGVRIHVTARTFNVLNTAAGLAGLAFAPKSDALREAKRRAKNKLAVVVSDARGVPVGKGHQGQCLQRPFAIECFLTPKESNELRAKILDAWRPVVGSQKNYSSYYWLQKDAETLTLLQKALEAESTTAGRYRVVGDRVTYGIAHGDDCGRLGPHADEPLQGGTHSLLVYLNDVPEGAGGRTRFFTDKSTTYSSRPERGKGVVFDIREFHDTEPIADGHVKVVVACELNKHM